MRALVVFLKLVLAYVAYTATFTCPITHDQLQYKMPQGFPVIDALNEKTCAMLHYQVKPSWNHYVFPSLLYISREVSTHLNHAAAFVESDVIPVVESFHESHVAPVISIVEIKSSYLFSIARIRAHKYLLLLNVHTKRLYYQYVYPVLHKLYEVEQVRVIVDWLVAMRARVWNSSPSKKFQSKLDFLRDEVKSVVKFNQFGKKLGHDFYVILALQEFFKDVIAGDDTTTKDSVTKASSDVTKSNTAVNFGSNAAETETNDSSIPEDSDEEVYTFTHTFTVTNTDDLKGMETVGPESGVSTEFIPSIEDELSLWSAKINKTLQLAVVQIEDAMAPIVNATIDALMDPVSAELQHVQKSTYKSYKEMNQMILDINKDYERIRNADSYGTFGISRQDVRDIIASTRQVPENSSVIVLEWLNAKHEKVVQAYFRVVQDTIDVLETYAETTIQEFQRKMGEILDTVDNDELVWSTWKRFHKIKEQIFDFRDYIFDQAEAYKANSKSTNAIGLREWNAYIGKVDFHVGFLLRDNDDYLKLVRAQANVAFQLREAEVRRIDEEKERREKERVEEEERERAEEEQRERERAEEEQSESVEEEQSEKVEQREEDELKKEEVKEERETEETETEDDESEGETEEGGNE